ncbi:MAG: sodium:calcium antiporter, partial [Acidobacteria bacterium]|nr:sodium:calcium antiporter [Acidobacteriota bacterium]
AGAAAAVTPAGLHVDGHFFTVLYPIMVFILIVFRLGILFSNESLKRPFGILMLAAYGFYVAAIFLLRGSWAGF